MKKDFAFALRDFKISHSRSHPVEWSLRELRVSIHAPPTAALVPLALQRDASETLIPRPPGTAAPHIMASLGMPLRQHKHGRNGGFFFPIKATCPRLWCSRKPLRDSPV